LQTFANLQEFAVKHDQGRRKTTLGIQLSYSKSRLVENLTYLMTSPHSQ